MIFYLQFFSSFEPVWVTDQWVIIFSILVEISLRYSNFIVKKSDLPGYHTPASYVLADFLLTLRGMISRGDCLAGV